MPSVDLDDGFSEKGVRMKKFLVALGVLAISVFVSACNGKGASTALFTVGGGVSGLKGTLVLQNNGGDDLTVTASGPFTFPRAMAPGSFYAVTVSTDPDGQTCVVSNGEGSVLIMNVSNVSVHCSKPGVLDATFNSPYGFNVQSDATGSLGDDSGKAVAVDAQGRILVTGSSTNGAGNKDMVVWRFTPDGILDKTFNGTGFVAYDNVAGGSGDDIGKGIAVDSLDGGILVTGSTTSAGHTDMALWRFKDDGTLDTTFYGKGLIEYNDGYGDESGNAVAVDFQDRILVTGSTTSAGNTDMAVWRFNANGTVDTSFNKTGIFVQNGVAGGNGNDSGNAIAVDSQGRIVIAGSSTNIAGNTDMVVWRFKSEGILDTTFNSPKGYVVNNSAANGNDSGNGINVYAADWIFVTGSSTNSLGNTDMAIWAFKADGTFNTSFNTNGIIVNNGAAGGNGNDSGNAITADSQGRILVTGSSTNSLGNTDMVVWRFNNTGTIDTAFGTTGILVHDSAAGGSGNDSGNAVAVDAQDRILVAGSSTNAAGNLDMAIWRVLP